MHIASKQDILDHIHQERMAFGQLLTEVGPARMALGGAMGEWTFKDLIAHLTAWWRRELGCLEAIRRGEAPMPHPDASEVELINNWIYHTQRDRPLEQLLHDVDEVWQQFEASICAMEESELMRAGASAGYDHAPLGARILSDFVNHYHNDHEADVSAWLARNRANEPTPSTGGSGALA